MVPPGTPDAVMAQTGTGEKKEKPEGRSLLERHGYRWQGKIETVKWRQFSWLTVGSKVGISVNMVIKLRVP
jgi:hypothetical protein